MHPEKIGKYVDIELIGKGGFGSVFKARDPTMDRLVAIKVCASDEEELRTRFLREAKIAGGLNHPNITMVFDFGLDEDQPYLVQELLTGENLERVIDLRKPFPPRKRLEILLEVAKGLEHAHAQGVLHRDVKPANIQILTDDRVKIMDFGMAKLTSSSETRLTEVGSVMGTPGYFAPEQLRAEELDKRVDIFSYGVLAYELLTYTKAFPGDTFLVVFRQVLSDEPEAVESLWPECPPAVAELVRHCMAKDRDDRCAGFSEIETRLREVLGGTPSGASRAPAFEAPPQDATIIRPLESPGTGDAVPPSALPEPSPEASPKVPLDLPVDRTVVLPTEPPPVKPAPITTPVEGGTVVIPPAKPARSEGKPAARPKRTSAPTRSGLSATRPQKPVPAAPTPSKPAHSKPTASKAPPKPGAGKRMPAAVAQAASSGVSRALERLDTLPGGKVVWIGAAAGLAAVLLLVVALLGGGEAPEAPVVAVPTEVPSQPAVFAEPTDAPRLPAAFVDATPWGELVRIVDDDGVDVELPVETHTPLALRLEAGRYEVHLLGPKGELAEPCAIETGGEVATPCVVDFGRATTNEFFGSLGWWR